MVLITGFERMIPWKVLQAARNSIHTRIGYMMIPGGNTNLAMEDPPNLIYFDGSLPIYIVFFHGYAVMLVYRSVNKTHVQKTHCWPWHPCIHLRKLTCPLKKKTISIGNTSEPTIDFSENMWVFQGVFVFDFHFRYSSNLANFMKTSRIIVAESFQELTLQDVAHLIG